MMKNSKTQLLGKFFLLITYFALISCGEGSDEKGDPSVLTQVPAPDEVTVWFTSSLHTGNMNGVNGANTICKNDTRTPDGLNNHRALLASANQDPRNFFSSNPSVKSGWRDGEAADTWSQFFDPSYEAPGTVGSTALYWTGFQNVSGALNTTHHCNNWTSDSESVSGGTGTGGATDIYRIALNTLDGCNLNAFSILCVSW